MQKAVERYKERAQAGHFLQAVCRWRAFPSHVPQEFAQHFKAADGHVVERLKAQGNRCLDWSIVFVSPAVDVSRIWNNSFEGLCLLEAHAGTTIENSRLRNCAVMAGSRLRDLSHAESVVFLSGCEVTRVGVVSCAAPHSFSIGQDIVFAPGGGNRRLPAFPEAPSTDLARYALLAPGDPSLAALREYCAWLAVEALSSVTIIAERATVRNCGTIHQSYIGPSARIDGAPILENSLLVSTEARPVVISAPGLIRRLVAHEGAEVASGATVDQVWMAECSWVRDGARASMSIIGPCSGVGCGELRSSFLGPFVGFSHEALCIATYWPGGKGNVSYGANVGSNHSGRAADQEHFAGEGVFYGLGTVIKFPFNTIDAPYSIIASGVCCLPQRIALPFSLINQPENPGPDIPRGLNEIFPGWQVRKNLYGLLRNQAKYKERNTAQRERIETRVFRPDMKPLVEEAIHRLEAARGLSPAGLLPSGEAYYLEAQIDGLGKNYLRRSILDQAIVDYRFAMRLIDLLGGQTTQSPADRKRIEAEIVETLVENRSRDDKRGARVIPDYPAIHGSLDDDPLIQKWRNIQFPKG